MASQLGTLDRAVSLFFGKSLPPRTTSAVRSGTEVFGSELL